MTNCYSLSRGSFLLATVRPLFVLRDRGAPSTSYVRSADSAPW